MSMLKILIADDHPMYRKGVRTILETVDDMEVVGEATNGLEALALCGETMPDVVLLDIRMPDMNGVEAAGRMKEAYPGVQILFLSMYQDDASVMAAMKTGARGYILKDADKDEILRAIRAVAAGEAIFGGEVATRLISFATRPLSHLDSFSQLTAREKEVLNYLTKGLTNVQIGERMDVSSKTVSNYVTLILNKLHAADRAAAVRMVEKAKGGD
ncbi:DNA-binding response regulator, NarL/FixJ family, contains REC and HTH domains [Paenibacillus sp. UNCCL117]|uniref:response regulator transcription factor n=1 Tax=unclassified Paenibacillus TaxID=185978 RepID=UPI00088C3BD8|nr:MULTISPECIES: response regulator transcription factor [unclassified Paenibacillus]SDE12339.1 DNA-binding response regulator, NarL/FixJ family, contains REC and HTH domains [Paenibacillus sp. cl123]SFW60160.1 DNA-binding response regulator, NarL/FixJ family, contains REC and HTH domains [Paenibacillus sp. UNCCL117]